MTCYRGADTSLIETLKQLIHTISKGISSINMALCNFVHSSPDFNIRDRYFRFLVVNTEAIQSSHEVADLQYSYK